MQRIAIATLDRSGARVRDSGSRAAYQSCLTAAPISIKSVTSAAQVIRFAEYPLISRKYQATEASPGVSSPVANCFSRSRTISQRSVLTGDPSPL